MIEKGMELVVSPATEFVVVVATMVLEVFVDRMVEWQPNSDDLNCLMDRKGRTSYVRMDDGKLH